MAGILERVGALAGTELSHAVDLAHHTFQDRVGTHRHVGRALVETAAEVCRSHPNLVGIGAGLMVEQLLVHEKHRHDAQIAAEIASNGLAETAPGALQTAPLDAPANDLAAAPAQEVGVKNAYLPHHMIRLSRIKPGRIAMEVFGALLLLKLAAVGAKFFRHKHQGEIWFAPAAKIRLFSGVISAYHLSAAVRSPKISAWRNAAIFFFGTDALKPILKPSRTARRSR